MNTLSIAERGIKDLLADTMDEWKEIKHIWTNTGRRIASIVKNAPDNGDKTWSGNKATLDYSFRKQVDGSGNVQWALIGLNGVDNASFGYAEIKAMTCAIGDLFTATGATALKPLVMLDKFLTTLKKMVDRYIKKWTDDITEFINGILVDFMYWKKLICWGEDAIKFLKKLNEEYGNQNIQSLSPFIADFCLLAKSCPLLKEYVFETDFMKRTARRINDLATDVSDFYSRQKADLSVAVGEYIDSEFPEFSKGVGDAMEWYKASKEGGDSASIELEIEGIKNDPKLTDAEKESRILAVRNRAKTIRENAKKYVASVLTLDELRLRAETDSKGFTRDQMEKGIPIGLDTKVYFEFDDSGNATSMKYVDEGGNICDESPISYNPYKPDSDFQDIINRLCNFTLSDLFGNVIAFIQSIMDAFTSFISTGIDWITRMTRKFLNIIRGIVETAISAFTPNLGSTIVKAVNFYKDWLRCQELFCPSPYTNKLIQVGRKAVSMFRTQVKYELVPDGVNADGTPRFKKQFYWDLGGTINEKLIDPAFKQLDDMIAGVGYVLKESATTCGVVSADGSDLISKTNRQYNEIMKPVTEKFDELLDMFLDPQTIIRALKSDNPRDEIQSLLGISGTWFDDNYDDIMDSFGNKDLTESYTLPSEYYSLFIERVSLQKTMKTKLSDINRSYIDSLSSNRVKEIAKTIKLSDPVNRDRVIRKIESIWLDHTFSNKDSEAITDTEKFTINGYLKIVGTATSDVTQAIKSATQDYDSNIYKSTSITNGLQMSFTNDLGSSEISRKLFGDLLAKSMPYMVDLLSERLEGYRQSLATKQDLDLKEQSLYSVVFDDIKIVCDRIKSYREKFERGLSKGYVDNIDITTNFFDKGSEVLGYDESEKFELYRLLSDFNSKEYFNENEVIKKYYRMSISVPIQTLVTSYIAGFDGTIRNAISGMSVTSTEISDKYKKLVSENNPFVDVDPRQKALIEKLMDGGDFSFREIEEWKRIEADKSDGKQADGTIQLNNVNIYSDLGGALVTLESGTQMVTTTNSRTSKPKTDRSQLWKLSEIQLGNKASVESVAVGQVDEDVPIIQRLQRINQ